MKVRRRPDDDSLPSWSRPLVFSGGHHAVASNQFRKGTLMADKPSWASRNSGPRRSAFGQPVSPCPAHPAAPVSRPAPPSPTPPSPPPLAGVLDIARRAKLDESAIALLQPQQTPQQAVE